MKRHWYPHLGQSKLLAEMTYCSWYWLLPKGRVANTKEHTVYPVCLLSGPRHYVRRCIQTLGLFDHFTKKQESLWSNPSCMHRCCMLWVQTFHPLAHNGMRSRGELSQSTQYTVWYRSKHRRRMLTGLIQVDKMLVWFPIRLEHQTARRTPI